MADRRQCASVAAAIIGLAFLLSACAALAPDNEHAAVPVLVVGNEAAINPNLVVRDSPLFRETVFANFESVLAKHGFRAVGEEAFRGRFDLNRGGAGPWGRWLDADFVAGAKRLSADGSGACFPFLVTARVYVRIWHNRPQYLNVEPWVRIYDTGSGERIGEAADNAEVPLPSYCPPGVCLKTMYRASAAGIFRPLGEAVARKLVAYRERDRFGKPARRCG
ncbi:MAG: hypothetical protein OXM58_13395 [Rhodospirillaceae bacterium]|nr:hypothetical protein [Rhodospirillaceae bacterium]MDE0616017.1 hypothetical protein [Rhodospirillaceae bacterium]